MERPMKRNKDGNIVYMGKGTILVSLKDMIRDSRGSVPYGTLPFAIYA